ncbi:rhomboid family intramembrane serine protease [Halodesulfurarchaeum sp.]|uniref:rhomboid family intramembrane serine protease n=1 Tax=Halodesulfurarchaeum sp. TaxID=1980530 RepID=UPI002FC34DF6
MVRCDYCGQEEGMPYQCRHCGGTFCSEHRLPENHDCPGLGEWDDPGGVFDSGFDASVSGSSTTERSASRGRNLLSRLGISTGPGGIGGYFRRNMTYVFLAIIWIVFPLEFVAFWLGGTDLFRAIFTLSSDNLAYVWTWVTSIFAHSPTGFMHILFNSIVLYFFGPIVERKVGSKNFAILFVGSGIVAGLAQVLATVAVGGTTSVLGASGAIMALMGVLTVLNPNLRIYIYFILPMPLWVATALFAGYSVLVSTAGGIGAGGVAQLAHLAGLGIGLLYGSYLKQRGKGAPKQLQIGGRGRGGRRR